MSYTFLLAKETYKFSCAHFTIFSAQKAELLHGHNYRVRFQITVSQVSPETGLCFDLADVKPILQRACSELDETILIPKESQFLTFEKIKSQTVVRFGDKSYGFPTEDVKELPLINISIEELSRYLFEKVINQLNEVCPIENLVVTVEETSGQNVSYSQKPI